MGGLLISRLSEFSSVAPDRLAEAIKEAVAKKPTGLILDLRGNPGGLLDSAVRIGSYFVKEGPIVIERIEGWHRAQLRSPGTLPDRRHTPGSPGRRRERQRL